MTNTFTNPYINGDPLIDITKPNELSARKVQFSVHKDDKMLLKLARPSVGTETTIMTILYREVCQAIRERKLTDFTSAKQLEDFICGLKLTYGKAKR